MLYPLYLVSIFPIMKTGWGLYNFVPLFLCVRPKERGTVDVYAHQSNWSAYFTASCLIKWPPFYVVTDM